MQAGLVARSAAAEHDRASRDAGIRVATLAIDLLPRAGTRGGWCAAKESNLHPTGVVDEQLLAGTVDLAHRQPVRLLAIIGAVLALVVLEVFRWIERFLSADGEGNG